MTTKHNIPAINNLEKLATPIQEANTYFLNKVQKQVNTALTFRNWLIGFCIVEYGETGKDRAEYGNKLYKAIAERLVKRGLKSN